MSYTKNTNLRKQSSIQSQTNIKYQFSDFILCTQNNILTQGEQMIPLHNKAIKCLVLLVTNANKVVPRELFFDYVWGDCFVDDGVLSVNISYLRKILGKNSIKTYSGRGYIFSKEVKVIEEKPYLTENAPSYQSIKTPNKSLAARLQSFWLALLGRFS